MVERRKDCVGCKSLLSLLPLAICGLSDSVFMECGSFKNSAPVCVSVLCQVFPVVGVDVELSEAGY